MIVVALAMAMTLRPSDGDEADASIARERAAKQAYETCMFSHAARMYHGNAGQQLEKAVADSCGPEFDEMVDAISEGGGPQARDAARAAMEQTVGDVAHLAVEAAQSH